MILYLNLLPKEQRKKIVYEKIYRFLRKEVLFMAALLVALGASSWYIKSTLKGNFAAIETELLENKEKHRPYFVKVQTINQEIENFKHIQESFVSPSQLLVALAQVVPEGINVTSISFEKSGTLLLQGTYETRAHLLNFKKQIETKLLDDVDFPIANYLSQQENDESGRFTVKGVVNDSVKERIGL